MKTMKIFLTAVMVMMLTVSFGQIQTGDTTVIDRTTDSDSIIGENVVFYEQTGDTLDTYSYDYTFLSDSLHNFKISSVYIEMAEAFHNGEDKKTFDFENEDSVAIGHITMKIDTSDIIVTYDVTKFQALFQFNTIMKMTIYYKHEGYVAVNEYNTENDFKVYSYNKTIKVETNETTPYEIYIHNLSGRTIYKGSSNGYFSKRLNEPNGIYLVNVVTDKGRLSKKIVLR